MYGFQGQAVGNKKTVIGGQKDNNPSYAVAKHLVKLLLVVTCRTDMH